MRQTGEGRWGVGGSAVSTGPGRRPGPTTPWRTADSLAPRRATRRPARAALLLAVGWLAGVWALSGCGPQDGGAPATKQAVLLGPEDVAVVARQAIESGPRLTGTLQPRALARVRAEVGGQVTARTVELGQTVRKGELLARIEDLALRRAFASAQAALASAEEGARVAQRQRQRMDSLVRGGVVTTAAVDQTTSEAQAAGARVDEARARLALARDQLEAATVRAPLAGVVAATPVSAGDIVEPGAELLTIIDPSSMRLQATVPSEALPQLAAGTPVDFQVRGLGDGRFSGTIESVSPLADPATRQLTVLVTLPNQAGGRPLVAGLFAEGRVASERRPDALVAPLASLIDGQGQGAPTVAVVRRGAVQRAEVAVGLVDPRSEQFEIRQGLAAGDIVLTGAVRQLAPGTPVELSQLPAGLRQATPASGRPASGSGGPAPGVPCPAGPPRSATATCALDPALLQPPGASPSAARPAAER